MFRDDSILPDDAARQRDSDSRRVRISDWLKNMKLLAEGGKLPLKPQGSLRSPITTPLLNPNPHYDSLPMSIEIDAPVEKVWVRVGKYCDIGEWAFQGCELLSGREGDIGAVRTIGHSIIVGQTSYSYIYTQPLRSGVVYPMYHGTLEARRLGPDRTTMHYTLVWDDSVQPDEAARPIRDRGSFRNSHAEYLQNAERIL